VIEVGDSDGRISTVCEDIWEPGPPPSTEALAGATVLVNISASPTTPARGPSASGCSSSAPATACRGWRSARSSAGQDRARLRWALADHRSRGNRRRPRRPVRRGAPGWRQIYPDGPRGSRPARPEASPGGAAHQRPDLTGDSRGSICRAGDPQSGRCGEFRSGSCSTRWARCTRRLLLGLRDYVREERASATSLLGVLGRDRLGPGATLAVDALGAD